MKFFDHILVSLLSAALSLTVFLIVLAQTLGSAAFLESAASKSHLYDNLATVLSHQLTTDAAARPAIRQAIDAAYLQQQAEALLPQVFLHYGEGGPTPLLDLSDLPPRLESAGFPVPSDLRSQLETPQRLNIGAADEQITRAVGVIRNLRWQVPVAVGVLVLIVVAALRSRALSALRRAALGAAISLAFSALLFFVIPHLIDTGLVSDSLKVLLPAIVGLVGAICGEITRQLLIGAAGMAVIAVVLGLVQAGLGMKGRLDKPKAKDNGQSGQ